MRTVGLCAALATLAWSSSAGAQSLSLTESDALARLSDASPRVRTIRSSIDLARADVVAAGRWPNPRVTFDRESAAGITEDLTMVAQGLPITGRRGFDVRAADAAVDAASNRANEALRRARADLRLAFAQLVAAQLRERELTGARERLRELAGVLAKREEAGEAAGFDRLRAEREVFDIESDLANAAIDRTRAQAAVVSFFAEPVDAARIVAVEGVRPRTDVPSIDRLLERAESARGELLALRKDLDAAHFAARSADRRRIPEPEIVGGTKSSSAAGGDLGSVLSLQAVVPLFDRGRPERLIAEARAKQAEARVDLFRIEVKSEIAAMRAAVIDRRGIADRYRAAAVNGAGQIERIAQVGYDAGERGILELLDAYRLGASARIRQTALDLAVRQAEIDLEFASGWDLSTT